MNEIEKTIRVLSDMKLSFSQNYIQEAFDVSIEALREQAERNKGCVFCNDERHRIREVFDEGTAKIISADNRYALSVDTSRDAAIFNVFYCPMCGKRLEATHA
jgi:hypothetical protein